MARETNDEQLPWETSSLIGDFYFNPSKVSIQAPLASTGGTPATTLEIEALEEEMQVTVSTATFRSLDMKGELLSELKPGRWVRVTGRIPSLGRYRVALDGKGVGYVPMSALEPPSYKRIGRLYKGALTNNIRSPDQVVTRFDFMNGKLFGTYTITEPRGKTDGTLRDFVPGVAGKGTFKWQDSYGGGTLLVEFDSNLASFQGKWQVDNMPDQGGQWAGSRQ